VLSGGGSGEAATSHSTGAANVRFGSRLEVAPRLSALSYTNPVSPKSNPPPTAPLGPLGPWVAVVGACDRRENEDALGACRSTRVGENELHLCVSSARVMRRMLCDPHAHRWVGALRFSTCVFDR